MRLWFLHVLIMLLWLFMVTATGKLNEFKDEILARIDEKYTELKDQIKNELAQPTQRRRKDVVKAS